MMARGTATLRFTPLLLVEAMQLTLALSPNTEGAKIAQRARREKPGLRIRHPRGIACRARRRARMDACRPPDRSGGRREGDGPVSRRRRAGAPLRQRAQARPPRRRRLLHGRHVGIRKYPAGGEAVGHQRAADHVFRVVLQIVERAADYGIPASDVVVDPLVMPIGAINKAGVQVMRLVRRLREELKVNTTCGASNVSFGLPNREGINAAFLTMAIASGLTSAITNPLHIETVRACMGADVMMGHDPDCARWIRRFREAPQPGADGQAGRGRREGGHRRRAARGDSWPKAARSSCSLLPASAGAFRWARLCCKRRVRSAQCCDHSLSCGVQRVVPITAMPGDV